MEVDGTLDKVSLYTDAFIRIILLNLHSYPVRLPFVCFTRKKIKLSKFKSLTQVSYLRGGRARLKPWFSNTKFHIFPTRHKIIGSGDTSGKEFICQCRRRERCWFNHWAEKIPWSRKWQCTPVFLPGKFHGQRRLAGCSPWGLRELDMTEHACTRHKITTMGWRPVLCVTV